MALDDIRAVEETDGGKEHRVLLRKQRAVERIESHREQMAVEGKDAIEMAEGR